MASEVDICNRAIQKVGGKRIASLSEDSTNARACNAAYDALRQAELRANAWSFAIDRASIAADADEPEFGMAYSYTQPSDCLRVLDPYPYADFNSRDWQIEGRKIYTDMTAPLEIRYIADVTEVSTMDALFREALAAKIAIEICEQITQSNTKKAALLAEYKDIIAQARKVNAFEKIAQTPPEDSWITART